MCNGKREVESGSCAEFAFGPDAAAIGLNYVLDNGQPESGAA
jgi:hypothetical protein